METALKAGLNQGEAEQYVGGGTVWETLMARFPEEMTPIYASSRLKIYSRARLDAVIHQAQQLADLGGGME